MSSSKRCTVIVGAFAAITLCAVASAGPQPPAPPNTHIDGTSEASFEASVAALQNALPPRRRENFEVALSAIWLSKALGPSGLDRNEDGIVDAIDSQLLVADTQHLLADIQRGDLLAAIGTREKKQGTYTVADYIKRLDGLGYDEVLDLAGRPTTLSLPPMHLPSPTIGVETSEIFKEAIEALKLQEVATARSAIEGLRLNKLSPFERSKAEEVLFNIAYDQGAIAEAREHLQKAMSAEGLNPQEVSAVLVEIRLLDAELGADPADLLPFPKLP